MKRLLAITLSIILVFSLCACGNKETKIINCLSCGGSISTNVAFCEHCGVATNITDDETNVVSSDISASYEETSKPTSSAQDTGKTSSYQNSSNKSSVPNSEHIHDYINETITKYPTCEGQGIKTCYCAHCPSTKAQTISALGHDWQNATCYSPKKCTKCLKIDGEKTDHKYLQNKCEYCGAERIKLSDKFVSLPQEIGGVYGTALLVKLTYHIDDNKIEFNYTVDTKEGTFAYGFNIKIVDSNKETYTALPVSAAAYPNQSYSGTVTCEGFNFLKLSPDINYYILITR